MAFPEINTFLNGFSSVSLNELDSLRLMNRTDTKFVFCSAKLGNLLSCLPDSYKILEVQNKKCFSYITRYFDTEDFLFFNQHVTGKLERHKIRFRKYESSGTTFLEIKRKTNKNRTVKWRTEYNNGSEEIDEKALLFIRKHIPFNSFILHPVLINKFTRITLKGHSGKEKLTFDFDLSFTSMTGEEVKLPHLAIGELKCEGIPSGSPFLKTARYFGIQPSGFSKYCIGNALLLDIPRKNTLKPKLLLLKKFENEFSGLFSS